MVFRRQLVLIFAIIVFSMLNANVLAAIYWDDGDPSSHYWHDGLNWNTNYVPSSGDAVIRCYTGVEPAVFDIGDGSSRSIGFVPVGYGAYSGELFIESGQLICTIGMDLNKYASSSANSVIHMNGGHLLVNGAVYVGYLNIGRAGTATFNMKGGTAETNQLQIPMGGTNCYSTFNLDGGVVLVHTLLNMSPGTSGSSRLNITDGKMILDETGTALLRVETYEGQGKIVAYPLAAGRGDIVYDYDIRNAGKVTVTAALTDYDQAWSPDPMDEHPDVERNSLFKWAAGDGAVEHEVYLGIDFNDVNNATDPNMSPGRGRCDVNSFSPENLVLGQKYYWRVDEVNDPAVKKGVIWEFTVSYDLKAYSPCPLNGAQDIEKFVTLEWTPGDTATDHDVYFGTNSSDVNNAVDPYTSPGRGRIDVNYYDPGALELDKTYYWRVDEYDGVTAHKGPLWEFKTVSGYTSDPIPHDLAKYVQTDKVLRWSAGTYSVSQDVYFGTSFSDVNEAIVPTVTTDACSYEPGTLAANKDYFWRVDANDGIATYTGSVWQFSTEPDSLVRAFPGAQGYGAYTSGGRGGDVYHVTNLTDDVASPSPGSLRYGTSTATGPRTIVFDVSGYIDLENRLEITANDMTIAGQTAPGDGVTLKRHDIRLYDSNNIIIRYLRVRPGYFETDQTISWAGYTDLDCLSIEGSNSVILDHISTSWSLDECMSIVGESNDITVQWCAMTEPLTKVNNDHSETSLLRPCINSRLSHHHNLYMSVLRRVSRFGNYNDNISTRFDWANNVVYNWGRQSTYSLNATGYWNLTTRAGGSTGGVDGELVKLNFMNNYFIAGPSTTEDIGTAYTGTSSTNHEIFSAGNLIDSDQDAAHNGIDTGLAMIDGGYDPKEDAFVINSPLDIESPGDAYNQILAGVGASMVRDAVDTRVLNELVTYQGQIIEDQNAVGAWPVLEEVSRPAGFDTDGDGMPDAWESPRGLNPNDASDRNADNDSDGYTNLEEYLNFLPVGQGKPVGDFDKDGDVDFEDLLVLISGWMGNNCNDALVGNLNYDCDVDFVDYAIFAENYSNE